ncbi:hypothetical protein D9613_012913 [Agrocybe pediades]|uniref:Ubiquitin-like domain-containing protein n=1 Tax=Agrocybe pediades TaxID=84607 RepID=A0A8H4QRF9_9AGAR|nr:hypothetical protein D9613_012913 [Agrocybe pediades]
MHGRNAGDMYKNEIASCTTCTALVGIRVCWLIGFIPALSQTSTTMSPSNTKIVSLSRSPVGETTQVNQSFFAGASNIIISGGQFNNVAGDLVIHPENWDRAEVEDILLQLLRTDLVRRSIAQIVGYNRENGGVTIIDALGEKLIFPPTIMAQFSDAHDNLSKHFRGKLGEDRVNSRRYCLVKQGDGMRVDEWDWNTVVQAGDVLVMCMLIKKVWVEASKPLSSTYRAVFIHLYQWDAALCREASRFEEVVSTEEETDLEELFKEEESDQEMC